MSESNMNLLLIVGLVVAGYWCFTQGPCATWRFGVMPAPAQGVTTAGTLLFPATGFGSC